MSKFKKSFDSYNFGYGDEVVDVNDFYFLLRNPNEESYSKIYIHSQ